MLGGGTGLIDIGRLAQVGCDTVRTKKHLRMGQYEAVRGLMIQ